MRVVRILQKALRIDRARVVDIDFAADGHGPLVLVRVQAHARARSRCPHCNRLCSGYDRAGRVRRWRHLDIAGTRCFIEASVSRVHCPRHGVVTEKVPWARPGANLTRAFDDLVAWLCAHSPLSAVGEVLRVSWRTVRRVVQRVVADATGKIDRLTGLRRIGIDEISYRKGRRYLTVVVDHETGRLVWAGEGGNKDSLHTFFDELGAGRTAELTHVSADGAPWIEAVLAERAPHTIWCMDPFHVIQWANRALDRCRSRLLGTVAGLTTKDRRHLRWALLKNPEDLTDGQRRVRNTVVANVNSDLAVAYQLKEGLRHLYSRTCKNPERALGAWIRRAKCSGLPEMHGLAASVEGRQIQIVNAIICEMSNARVEATNTHLRALTKRSYGFHSAEALIAMATLTRGGVCPALPHN